MAGGARRDAQDTPVSQESQGCGGQSQEVAQARRAEDTVGMCGTGGSGMRRAGRRASEGRGDGRTEGAPGAGALGKQSLLFSFFPLWLMR